MASIMLLNIDLEGKIETILVIFGLLGACALLAWMIFFHF